MGHIIFIYNFLAMLWFKFLSSNLFILYQVIVKSLFVSASSKKRNPGNGHILFSNKLNNLGIANR